MPVEGYRPSPSSGAGTSRHVNSILGMSDSLPILRGNMVQPIGSQFPVDASIVLRP